MYSLFYGTVIVSVTHKEAHTPCLASLFLQLLPGYITVSLALVASKACTHGSHRTVINEESSLTAMPPRAQQVASGLGAQSSYEGRLLANHHDYGLSGIN